MSCTLLPRIEPRTQSKTRAPRPPRQCPDSRRQRGSEEGQRGASGTGVEESQASSLETGHVPTPHLESGGTSWKPPIPPSSGDTQGVYKPVGRTGRCVSDDRDVSRRVREENAVCNYWREHPEDRAPSVHRQSSYTEEAGDGWRTTDSAGRLRPDWLQGTALSSGFS